MQKAIWTADITKTIKGQEILKGINLEIYEGEVFGFIGPNGAGKTTLMKLLAGLMEPTEGVVETNIKKEEKGALIENPAAYSWLSGYKNLVILANMYGNISKAEIDNIVNIVGLQEHIYKKYGTYSIGQKQRLGIAMTLLHHPKLVLLDEPTNGLDFDGVCQMRDIIVNLGKKIGCTVIVSSHILAEMDKICDRAAFIRDGRILEIVDRETIENRGLECKYKELIRGETGAEE